MFCSKCGTKLNDDARFCYSCGAQVNNACQSVPAAQTTASVVLAKCTNCGGNLSVDPNMQAAVCPFCNSTFIVSRAINNYNLTVQGNLQINNATVNVTDTRVASLISRAEISQRNFDSDEAKRLYIEALQLDINSVAAREGLISICKKNADYYESRKHYSLAAGEWRALRNLNLIADTRSIQNEINRLDNLSLQPKYEWDVSFGTFFASGSGKIIIDEQTLRIIEDDSQIVLIFLWQITSVASLDLTNSIVIVYELGGIASSTPSMHPQNVKPSEIAKVLKEICRNLK